MFKNFLLFTDIIVRLSVKKDIVLMYFSKSSEDKIFLYYCLLLNNNTRLYNIVLIF